MGKESNVNHDVNAGIALIADDPHETLRGKRFSAWGSDAAGIQAATDPGGGITGGISDGSEIIFRVAIKPTPSISKLQNTVNDKNQNVKIKISGHHDKIIVPRISVVIESMAAIVLVDQIFLSCCSQIKRIKQNYFGWWKNFVQKKYG